MYDVQQNVLKCLNNTFAFNNFYITIEQVTDGVETIWDVWCLN